MDSLLCYQIIYNGVELNRNISPFLSFLSMISLVFLSSEGYWHFVLMYNCIVMYDNCL